LAIRSMRLLGIVFLCFGLLVLGLSWMVTARPSGASNMMFVNGAPISLVYLIPGVLYLVFVVFLSRRQPWAAVGGMVVAILQLPVAAIALVMVVLHGVPLLPLVLSALWVAGLIQLIYHLSKSFAAIRFEAISGARGFEPLPPTAPPAPSPLPGERV
jgi:hypothetical protein